MDYDTYYVGANEVFVHNCKAASMADDAAEAAVKSGKKTDVTTGIGYDAGDTPVRIEGEWSINDMKQGLLGHPPKGLGSPDIHHGGQMPGAAKHEIIPSQHRNNNALHLNKYNQGLPITSNAFSVPSAFSNSSFA